MEIESAIQGATSHCKHSSCIYGTPIKKVIGEGHACDRPLRSVINVTYGDGL